jgi:hypothetical protein
LDPKDEGDMFLRNVGELLPDYTRVISKKIGLFIVTAVIYNPCWLKFNTEGRFN